MIEKGKKLSDNAMADVSGGITSDDALNLALKHANLTKSQINLKKSKLDHEHGMMVYEVEFVANGMEYEFDIDSETGEILKYEKERWD